jgi:beta-1,4-mannosyltransferase
MQYHALSLAQNDYVVDLIGYEGTTPLQSILTSPNITLHAIPTPAKLAAGLPRWVYLVRGVQRVVWQVASLLNLLLFVLPKPDFILIQVIVTTILGMVPIHAIA